MNFYSLLPVKPAWAILSVSGAICLSLGVIYLTDNVMKDYKGGRQGNVLNAASQSDPVKKVTRSNNKSTKNKNSPSQSTPESSLINNDELLVPEPAASQSTTPDQNCNEQLTLSKAKACSVFVQTDRWGGSGFAIQQNYIVTSRH